MINREDVTELRKEFDDRYVLQSDCNDTQVRVSKMLANDDKRIEIISHDFKAIKWLVATVASASIGTLVTALIELFVK